MPHVPISAAPVQILEDALTLIIETDAPCSVDIPCIYAQQSMNPNPNPTLIHTVDILHTQDITTMIYIFTEDYYLITLTLIAADH